MKNTKFTTVNSKQHKAKINKIQKFEVDQQQEQQIYDQEPQHNQKKREKQENKIQNLSQSIKMIDFISSLYKKYQILNKLSDQQSNRFQQEVISMLVDESQNVDMQLYQQTIEKMGLSTFILQVLTNVLTRRNKYKNKFEMQRNLQEILKQVQRRQKQMSIKRKQLSKRQIGVGKKQQQLKKRQQNMKLMIRQQMDEIQKKCNDRILNQQSEIKKRFNTTLSLIKQKQKQLSQKVNGLKQSMKKIKQIDSRQKQIDEKMKMLQKKQKGLKMREGQEKQNVEEKQEMNRKHAEIKNRVMELEEEGRRQKEELAKMSKKLKTSELAYKHVKDQAEKKVLQMKELAETQRYNEGLRKEHESMKMECEQIKTQCQMIKIQCEKMKAEHNTYQKRMERQIEIKQKTLNEKERENERLMNKLQQLQATTTQVTDKEVLKSLVLVQQGNGNNKNTNTNTNKIIHQNLLNNKRLHQKQLFNNHLANTYTTKDSLSINQNQSTSSRNNPIMDIRTSPHHANGIKQTHNNDNNNNINKHPVTYFDELDISVINNRKEQQNQQHHQSLLHQQQSMQSQQQQDSIQQRSIIDHIKKSIPIQHSPLGQYLYTKVNKMNNSQQQLQLQSSIHKQSHQTPSYVHHQQLNDQSQLSVISKTIDMKKYPLNNSESNEQQEEQSVMNFYPIKQHQKILQKQVRSKQAQDNLKVFEKYFMDLQKQKQILSQQQDDNQEEDQNQHNQQIQKRKNQSSMSTSNNLLPSSLIASNKNKPASNNSLLNNLDELLQSFECIHNFCQQSNVQLTEAIKQTSQKHKYSKPLVFVILQIFMKLIQPCNCIQNKLKNQNQVQLRQNSKKSVLKTISCKQMLQFLSQCTIRYFAINNKIEQQSILILARILVMKSTFLSLSRSINNKYQYQSNQQQQVQNFELSSNYKKLLKVKLLSLKTINVDKPSSEQRQFLKQNVEYLLNYQ